ncbi:hypothetical protein [Streptomyces sp. NPDC001970]
MKRSLRRQRIVQLLAVTGGPYDPDADVVVQEKLVDDRRRAEAEQQRRQISSG